MPAGSTPAQRPMTTVTMLDLALDYLGREWSIFPVCTPTDSRSCQQHGRCEHPGKVPLVRWKDYQSDIALAAEVRQWWRRWPTANIGMATGRLSDVVVIDLDGDLAWREAERRGLVDGPLALTGRVGGRHVYCRYRDDEPGNFAHAIGGIDYRGEGGYVLLPGSLHHTGARYRWLTEPEAGDPLPGLPRWVNEIAPREVRGENGQLPRALDVSAILEQGVPEGERDWTLFRLASKFRAADLPYELAVQLVQQTAAKSPGSEPFTAEEARAKVDSAYRRYAPGTPLLLSGPVSANGVHTDPTTGEVTDPAASGLVAITALDLFPATPPRIPWLVHEPSDLAGGIGGGLLAERNIALLGADSGLGKTWVLADLVLALTLGGALFQSFAIARPCRVMLVDEESSLHLYQDRWPRLLRGRQVTQAEFLETAWPNIRIYLDQGFSFDSDKGLAALHREAEAFRPDIVLFDSLSRVHRRAENDNSAIAALFEDRIKPFLRTYGTALLFAHHTRKPSKDASNDAGSMLRGASDLKAQLDQYWFLRGKANVPKLLFEHDKCRVAPAIAPFTLVREVADDGSVTLRRAEGQSVHATQADLAAATVLAFLVERGPMPRAAILEFCKGRGIGDRTAKEALSVLFDQDEVAKSRDGKETIYSVVEDDL